MGYKQYCKDYENIENYQKALADNFVGWHCHHRLETHTPDGKRREVDITQKELMALNMYYHRPAEELIFLTESEHKSFQKGKKRSAEAKNKMSEAWDYDRHFNEETRRRMSEAAKGKNIWSKCTHWYNNGKINTMAKECPPGFVPGRIKKL